MVKATTLTVQPVMILPEYSPTRDREKPQAVIVEASRPPILALPPPWKEEQDIDDDGAFAPYHGWGSLNGCC